MLPKQDFFSLLSAVARLSLSLYLHILFLSELYPFYILQAKNPCEICRYLITAHLVKNIFKTLACYICILYKILTDQCLGKFSVFEFRTLILSRHIQNRHFVYASICSITSQLIIQHKRIANQLYSFFIVFITNPKIYKFYKLI